MPHLGVLDADPPAYGDSAAQSRAGPGQIGVLVPYLPGGRHRSGRGLVAVPGGERFHPVQQGTCPKDGAARPNS